MTVLTISSEQLVNGVQMFGAASAIGGAVISVALAIFNQDYTQPCTVMVLGASTWVIISIGGCSQKTVSEDESTTEETIATQVIEDTFIKPVDQTSEEVIERRQDPVSDLVDLEVVKSQAESITASPDLRDSLGPVIELAEKSSKSLSNMGINSSINFGAKRLEGSIGAKGSIGLKDFIGLRGSIGLKGAFS